MSSNQESKEENYYYLTIDSNRMIDAGPKGNLARYIRDNGNGNQCYARIRIDFIRFRAQHVANLCPYRTLPSYVDLLVSWILPLHWGYIWIKLQETSYNADLDLDKRKNKLIKKSDNFIGKTEFLKIDFCCTLFLSNTFVMKSELGTQQFCRDNVTISGH